MATYRGASPHVGRQIELAPRIPGFHSPEFGMICIAATGQGARHRWCADVLVGASATLIGVNETSGPDAWLTLPDLAEQLGVRIGEVRRMLEERQLVALRRGERKVLSVPAAFIGEHGPLPELPGTFTVLSDSGLSDEEIIEWMFALDDTLPGGPTPIDAIRAGFKTEVRRRAMEEAL